MLSREQKETADYQKEILNSFINKAKSAKIKVFANIKKGIGVLAYKDNFACFEITFDKISVYFPYKIQENYFDHSYSIEYFDKYNKHTKNKIISCITQDIPEHFKEKLYRDANEYLNMHKKLKLMEM